MPVLNQKQLDAIANQSFVPQNVQKSYGVENAPDQMVHASDLNSAPAASTNINSQSYKGVTAPSSQAKPVMTLSTDNVNKRNDDYQLQFQNIQQGLQDAKQKALDIQKRLKIAQPTTQPDTNTREPQGQTLLNSGKDGEPTTIDLDAVANQTTQTLNNDYNTAIDSIANLVSRSDNMAAENLSNIAQMFNVRVQQQQEVNRRTLSMMQMQGMRSGMARYAPQLNTSILSSQEAQGIQQLTQLDVQEQQAVLEAQQAHYDRNFQLLSTKLGQMQQFRAEKQNLINNLSTLAANNQAMQLKQLQDARDAEKFTYDMATQKAQAVAGAVADAVDKVTDPDDKMLVIEQAAKEQGVSVDIMESEVEDKLRENRLADLGLMQKQQDYNTSGQFNLPDGQTRYDANGNPIAGAGVSLAQRNNNPGNLRYTGQDGATIGDGGFAKFDSMQAGFQALVADLHAKQTGDTSTGLNGNSSILDLAKIYAPASDGNVPTDWANNVAAQLGVDVNTKIGSIDTNDLAGAVAVAEDRNAAQQLGGDSQSGVSPALSQAIQNGQIDPNHINSRTLGIYNKIAEDGLNATGAHASAMAQSKAVSNLYDQLAVQKKTLGVIDANMPLLVQSADAVNTLGIPGLDSYIQGIKSYTGNDTNVIQYVNTLKTIRSEYAQMLAKGGAITEGDKAEAAQAVPVGLTGEGYTALADRLKQESENILNTTQQTLNDAINNSPINGAQNQTINGEGGSKGSQSDKDFVASALSQAGVGYQQALNGAHSGEIAVVENSTGNIGYIPPKEFDSNKYTKL